MEDLCTACLCTGRNLYFIGETGFYHLYSQILNEIPVYDMSSVCVRVCWECRALLRRFAAFKACVKRSYSELLHQLHQNVPSSKLSLARAPKLQVQCVTGFSWPEQEIKKEGADAARQESCDVLRTLEHDLPEHELNQDVVVKSDPVSENDVKQEIHTEEAYVGSVQVKLPKKASKKTTKGKVKKKKLKTKEKKSKKKVNQKKTKKDAELSSVTSEESSRLLICEDFSDGVDSDDEVLKKIEIEREIINKPDTKESVEKKVEKAIVSKKLVKKNGSLPPESGRDPAPDGAGDKPKCTECGKMFSSKKTYRYHLNTLHKGQNRYPCPRCGKVYQWKSNLGRHMRSHKARDSGELYCSTCDKRFASVATYRQHLRVSRRHVSENEFSFMCNECGKKFVNKTRLRDHVDWDHLHKVKFRCDLCNKPFKCHTSLYVHTQNVHRRRNKDNLCHICGKSYQNAAKLKYHIVAMHTSETPYRCEHCRAAFGWYSSLYRHVREVHYKMKLQPKKMRKTKRTSENDPPPPPPPPHSHAPPHGLAPHVHQPGPTVVS